MTPTCKVILSDYSASDWLKDALRTALERDPVDAVRDAEILAAALSERCYAILTQHEHLLRGSDHV
jgi:hypothetical protein